MDFKLATSTLLLFSILIFSGCNTSGNSGGYTITGYIEGVDQGMVRVYEINYVDRFSKSLIDSAKIVDGTFLIEGKVDHIDMVSLEIDNQYSMDLFLENSDIVVDIDLDKTKESGGTLISSVSGSASHNEWVEERAREEAFQGQLDIKYPVLTQLRLARDSAYRIKDKDLVEEITQELIAHAEMSDQRNKEYIEVRRKYARDHPESPVATYILGFFYGEGRMTLEELEEYYQLFQGEARNTQMFAYYTKIHTEVFESMGVGATVPDFSLTTVDGEELALSKVNGKYTLVDFWASWCVPCRESFPYLKELENKYKKDGFNIVAIGTADEEPKWRKAIEQDQTTWSNVYDPADPLRRLAYGKVAISYGVPFLPTTFLLDEDMKIVGRNLEKEDLVVKLEELFGY